MRGPTERCEVAGVGIWPHDALGASTGGISAALKGSPSVRVAWPVFQQHFDEQFPFWDKAPARGQSDFMDMVREFNEGLTGEPVYSCSVCIARSSGSAKLSNQRAAN